MLAGAGWDVEHDGLVGAPAIQVVASEERHATIDRALRLLGLGRRCIVEVPAASNGAIDIAALARTSEADIDRSVEAIARIAGALQPHG